jgi:hypothetical protein
LFYLRQKGIPSVVMALLAQLSRRVEQGARAWRPSIPAIWVAKTQTTTTTTNNKQNNHLILIVPPATTA